MGVRGGLRCGGRVLEVLGAPLGQKKARMLGLNSPTNIIQFYQTDLVFFCKLVVWQGKAV